MKKYVEIQVELIQLQKQDVVTLSGFEGGMDEFDNPNQPKDSAVGDF